MAENYSFFNSKDHDRIYNARHWADYFFPLFKSGVFNGSLQVVANGGMSVKIKEGYAWIDGYAYHLTEGLVIDLETASGNMNRSDSIVIRLDLTNRWVKAFCKTGSYYAGTPTPPEPEITATIHEIVIAHITVAAGTTEITQSMIEDTRMDNSICGWVCGAVEQIDFAQIKTQFDAFFAEYEADIAAEYALYLQNINSMESQGQERYNSMDQAFTAYEAQQKADFESWVDSIKEILDEAAAGHLQNEIEALQTETTEGLEGLKKQVDFDWLGFRTVSTTFNSDGSITATVTDSSGKQYTMTTVFNSDGSITDTAADTNGQAVAVKTTVFNSDGSITETVTEPETA